MASLSQREQRQRQLALQHPLRRRRLVLRRRRQALQRRLRLLRHLPVRRQVRRQVLQLRWQVQQQVLQLLLFDHKRPKLLR